jgi:UDP-N-acetylglucosamine 2-epimerase (non-hydrolysing)
LKVMTILGTRPEIIRLSLIIKLLDQYASHILVHTGQNYDHRLSELFFRELHVRRPDVFLNVDSSSFGVQVGQILARIEPILVEHHPDRVLLLGDTNSALTAIVARRLAIPVYHVEAGNRCNDFRVPEETNRRIVDHVSSVLMPYTNRSRENLLREGISAESIYVTGNPIYEVMQHYSNQIAASAALSTFGLQPNRFFLVTLHRSENVDDPRRLHKFVNMLTVLNEIYGLPVLCSLHPRTRAKMREFDISLRHPGVRFVEPLGFFDFVRLEESAFCVLSDSGTVQEETCILGIPCVTIRDATERPETIECGSTVLSGSDTDSILTAVRIVTGERRKPQPPAEYVMPHVSNAVIQICLGHSPNHADNRDTVTSSSDMTLSTLAR